MEDVERIVNEAGRQEEICKSKAKKLKEKQDKIFNKAMIFGILCIATFFVGNLWAIPAGVVYLATLVFVGLFGGYLGRFFENRKILGC